MTCADNKVRIYMTVSAVDVVGEPNYSVSARIVNRTHDGYKWNTCREVITPTYLINQLDPLPDTQGGRLDLLNHLLFQDGKVYTDNKEPQSVVAVQAQNTNATQSIGSNPYFVGTQFGALITDASDTSITMLYKVSHSVRCVRTPSWFFTLWDPCVSAGASDESESIIKQQSVQSSARFQPGVEQLVASLTFEKTDEYTANV